KEADVAIGSRFLGKTKQPLWRRVGIKIITRLTKEIHKLPRNITDSQSGYRAYSRRAVQLVAPEDSDMGASIDVLYQVAKYNLRITEVPITINYHKEASTQNPLAHASRVIARIIGIVVEKHPLLYLGLPGAILTLIGILSATYAVWLFNQTRYFSIPATLIAIAFTFIGTLLVIASLILYAIANIRKT
ncbi:MAG: glycosyltransferase, partial [Candidatus Njordarchaeales archaeon]